MNPNRRLRTSHFCFVRDLVREATCIELDDKEYLVEHRLARLQRERGYACIDDLIEDARKRPRSSLATQLIEAMTTNETSFFRDQAPFEALRSRILPELVEQRRHERSLRIWCAACSSGQEPYSLAMLLHEEFDLADWRVELFATDISEKMVKRTREGFYDELEVRRGLPEGLVRRYMQREKGGYRMSTRLRDLIEAKVLNLGDAWPNRGAYDLVLMRNVLIYFSLEVRQDIFRRVRALLHPWSRLLLGAGETTLNLDSQLRPEESAGCRCYRLAEVG